MAVYTQVSAEALAAFLTRYDVGELVSAKGIAEGVENSNYLVDTTAARFILTLYEKRVSADDLPFFMALLDHLADKGLPVPPAIKDRGGVEIQELAGRPACLIRFLTGVSVSHPTPAQAHAAARAMADMHMAVADFAPTRANSMGIATWRPLLERMGADMDAIDPGLFARVDAALREVEAAWPATLPVGAIHADLFPDNVLMLGDTVSGLIDFYFACTDVRAYDLAIMHSAWTFDATGRTADAAIGAALLAGYADGAALSAAERAALPLLAQGACIRFLLSRAWDWLHTPADALVMRKDPLAYARRLDWYRTHPGAFA
ncbi:MULTISPECIES: homoserine kinase [Sphingomonas]|jgi:homoserine kinase type II|uniref:Homoserine kinase n=1 Tax=Sphingomonas ginsenosidimutans TaxID=862134 RepID=A0A2A4I2Q0_9SPHN|nr:MULTISPECIES: homoserine kinase [Sphingomonas]MBY0300619.1 homoserine kinase [Sphingomonas ginsenosidimutans]PCG10215.1 homoserine kinase [Sphingomonas ginsenosidimutans]